MELGMFLALLTLLNLIAVAVGVYIFNYGYAGLHFLEHVEKVLHENNEQHETDILITEDIPKVIYGLMFVRSVIITISLSILLNSCMFVFFVFPELQSIVLLWNIMVWITSLLNAFVILSIVKAYQTKWEVNAICSSYNALIEAIAYIKEAENDSVK